MDRTPSEIFDLLIEFVDASIPASEPMDIAFDRDLKEAIYTIEEGGFWPDDPTERMVFTWRLVEALRRRGRLPDNCCM